MDAEGREFGEDRPLGVLPGLGGVHATGCSAQVAMTVEEFVGPGFRSDYDTCVALRLKGR